MPRLLDIRIRKEDILRDVRKITEYFGSRNADEGGNSTYDDVAVTRYDQERLDDFWAETCNLIAEPIKQFIVYSRMEEDALCLGLGMPSNYIVSFDEPIKSAVYEFIKNSIAAKWYGIVFPAESEKHSSIAAANLIELRNKLFARKAPSRMNPK